MKNLYKIFFCVPMFLCCLAMQSQEYITWDPAVDVLQLTGTFVSNGGGNVTVDQGIGGVNISMTSPSGQQGNLIVNGANTFSTYGATNNPPSRDLVFNFSRPVIITRYNMADIDLGFVWDDSFNFVNIAFTDNPSPEATDCTATLTGAVATGDTDANGEFASWYCSSEAVTSFSLSYLNTGGNTHAYLAYSIQILVPPTVGPFCLGEVGSLPEVIGNNIAGSWDQPLNTSVAGTHSYTFTPTSGQAISCPVTIEVLVNDCCLPDLTLSSPLDNMDNNSPDNISLRERGNTITASNIIGIGNNFFQDGVVYHAGNYVDLVPGFDAVNGSQFVAYPQGCTGNTSFIYKKQGTVKNMNSVLPEHVESFGPKIFNLYLNKETGKLGISMINAYMNEINIYSLDGKNVFNDSMQRREKYEFDPGNLRDGVYIVSVTSNGQKYSQKFIKK